MTERDREMLVEEAASAWRPRTPDGQTLAHPAWADLDAAATARGIEETLVMRVLEAALDPDGLLDRGAGSRGATRGGMTRNRSARTNFANDFDPQLQRQILAIGRTEVRAAVPSQICLVARRDPDQDSGECLASSLSGPLFRVDFARSRSYRSRARSRNRFSPLTSKSMSRPV